MVLTADHGTSRLAVLAHLAKKNKTLDDIAGTTPVSWRIAEINNVSTNVDSGDVVANLENTHVSVKGYNRFSFSGGCGFEIHGGATVEECVVPFIVFEKGATYVPPVKIVSDESTAQIVEDSDFDI